MGTMKRRTIIMGVVVLACVLAVGAVYVFTVSGPRANIRSRGREFSREVVVDRIADLTRVPAYRARVSFSGGSLPAARLPISPEADALELEVFRKDFRILHLCEDLAALGPQKATGLVNESISQYFDDYKTALETSVACAAGKTKLTEEERENVLHESQGRRWRLLTLVLAAGNLELSGTHEAILKLTHEALSQRERFPAAQELDEQWRFQLLAWHGLYQREILGYGLLRTCPDRDLAQATLKSLGKQIRVKELWGIEDTLIRSQAELLAGPVDYAKGVPEMRSLEPITDEEFDRIVAALRAAEAVETERSNE